MMISQEAIDLIVAEEVSSKSEYEKNYRHPEWPGGSSGITIGIGYDVGAGVKSFQQLHDDWTGKIPEAMIETLRPAIGVTGNSASAMLPRMKSVDVPWDAAMAVFSNKDVPKWYGICKNALPNFELLSPDCKGVLLSLAYNRGPSFDTSGDRYTEMRAIKAHMVNKQFAKIPAEFRSMKRIWVGKGLDGLLKRRDKEAALFEKGLKMPVEPPSQPKSAQPVPLPTAAKPKSWWETLFGAPAVVKPANTAPQAPNMVDAVVMQQKLIDAGVLDPPADGKVGSVTQWAQRQALPAPIKLGADDASKIAAVMVNFKFWMCRVPGTYNNIMIEGANADLSDNGNPPDRWNDRRILLSFKADGTPFIVCNFSATTEPSKYWTDHPMNPGGAFRIAFGQQACWTPGDYHGPAMRQNGRIVGYRDKAHLFRRMDGTRWEGDDSGVHHHQGYNLTETLQNAAAGCQVTEFTKEHNWFMTTALTDPRQKASASYKFRSTVFPVAAFKGDRSWLKFAV